MAKEELNYWTLPALPRTDEAIAVQIISELNEFAGVDLKTHTRKRYILEPRQVACYMIRKNTELSLHQVGDLLGIDHSSVCHSVDLVMDLKKNNRFFAERWGNWLNRRYRPRFEKTETISDLKTINYEQSKTCEEQN